jgi:hypothetical protein
MKKNKSKMTFLQVCRYLKRQGLFNYRYVRFYLIDHITGNEITQEDINFINTEMVGIQ